MAITAARKLAGKVFLLLNILLSLLLLLACANEWLHPDRWWLIAILGLIFPYLLLGNLLFLLGWLFFRSRWALLPFLVLLLSVGNIRALLGFHFKKKFEKQKQQHSLRVLSWNVRWFDGQTKAAHNEHSQRPQMFAFLRRQNADVLCFQEYLASAPGSSAADDIVAELEHMGYTHHYIARDYSLRGRLYQAGVAIFSRFPITDTSRLQYPGPLSDRAAESLISADIEFRGQKIRIFTTHLQSWQFRAKDYHDLEIIRNAEDSLIGASRSILRKFKLAYSYRGYQADLVKQEIDQSPYPAIICGDFNDVPNSYTYFRIRGDRLDAFVAEGAGIGRTFSGLAPTLRIDYIFADPVFRVLQYRRSTVRYSDHFPVLADLTLPRD